MNITKLIRYNNYMSYVTMISFIGTIDSLFISEIMKLVPCSLCWYQRICLYPIFIMYIVSLIKKYSHANEYIKYFSGIGLLIFSYQYTIQMTHTKSAFCHLYEDFSAVDFIFQKFITIPFLAILAFLLIFRLTFFVKNSK